METLKEILERNKGANGFPDKDSTHSYLGVYAEILAPYRKSNTRVCEIGLFSGESLKMWEQYFADGIVYGIDCTEQPHGGMADLRPMIESGEHNIYLIDSTNADEVNSIFEDQTFNVLIDDGAHDIQSQLKTFEAFKRKMIPGSLYIIEDVEDIDSTRWVFDSMSGNFTVEVVDLRHIKNRFDDVLILIKFK